MFLTCRPFVVITFSTGLVDVENVVITTKGLQDRNSLLLDGRTLKNKGKLILTIDHSSKLPHNQCNTKYKSLKHLQRKLNTTKCKKILYQ